MSGGIAYVLDLEGDFARHCNRGMVDLEPLVDAADLDLVHGLVSRHRELTNSTRAALVLTNWTTMPQKFVRVVPQDYKRVLQAEARARAEAREPEFAELVGAAY